MLLLTRRVVSAAEKEQLTRSDYAFVDARAVSRQVVQAMGLSRFGAAEAGLLDELQSFSRAGVTMAGQVQRGSCYVGMLIVQSLLVDGLQVAVDPKRRHSIPMVELGSLERTDGTQSLAPQGSLQQLRESVAGLQGQTLLGLVQAGERLLGRDSWAPRLFDDKSTRADPDESSDSILTAPDFIRRPAAERRLAGQMVRTLIAFLDAIQPAHTISHLLPRLVMVPYLVPLLPSAPGMSELDNAYLITFKAVIPASTELPTLCWSPFRLFAAQNECVAREPFASTRKRARKSSAGSGGAASGSGSTTTTTTKTSNRFSLPAKLAVGAGIVAAPSPPVRPSARPRSATFTGPPRSVASGKQRATENGRARSGSDGSAPIPLSEDLRQAVLASSATPGSSAGLHSIIQARRASYDGPTMMLPGIQTDWQKHTVRRPSRELVLRSGHGEYRSSVPLSPVFSQHEGEVQSPMLESGLGSPITPIPIPLSLPMPPAQLHNATWAAHVRRPVPSAASNTPVRFVQPFGPASPAARRPPPEEAYISPHDPVPTIKAVGFASSLSPPPPPSSSFSSSSSSTNAIAIAHRPSPNAIAIAQRHRTHDRRPSDSASESKPSRTRTRTSRPGPADQAQQTRPRVIYLPYRTALQCLGRCKRGISPRGEGHTRAFFDWLDWGHQGDQRLISSPIAP